MATNILSVASTAASSSDVTIAAGESLTVCLKTSDGSPVPVNAAVRIELKDDASVYHGVGRLEAGKTSTVIVGAGVYRFTRIPGASCGVFSGV